MIASGVEVVVEDISSPEDSLRDFIGTIYLENAMTLLAANAKLEIEYEDGSRDRMFLTKANPMDSEAEFRPTN